MRPHRYIYITFILLFFAISLFNLRYNYSLLPSTLHHEPSNINPTDYWTWDTSSQFRPQTVANPDPKDPCASFPSHLLKHIQVVLKIGSSELSDRLDTQLSTVTRCISNLIIFSDRDQNLRGHPVYDILADLPPSYMTNNSDFDTYRGIPEEKPGSGWRLDRYKFLPMVERAYKMNPTAEWFVFLEADTYLVWDNLFRLLEHFDPNTPLYMGSPSPGRHLSNGQTTWFAYRGTGIVISSAAVERIVRRGVGEYGEYVQPSLTERYEDDVKGDCCGDSVLGWALYQAGIPLSGLWPSFNPHPFHSIPFAEAYWCQPIISAHRSRPDEMKEFSKFEVQRGWSVCISFVYSYKSKHTCLQNLETPPLLRRIQPLETRLHSPSGKLG